MITLEDQEARHLAAIIGGMTYKPKQLESVEMAFNDLIIEWYKIEPQYASAGKSIEELNVRQNSGVSFIVVMEDQKTNHINPGPDTVLKANSTVLAVGERD